MAEFTLKQTFEGKQTESIFVRGPPWVSITTRRVADQTICTILASLLRQCRLVASGMASGATLHRFTSQLCYLPAR